MTLDADEALKLVAPGGEISMHLRAFESRPQQQQMVRQVVDAYNDKHISLIEAGTGTGKSLAYLIPAVLWALKNKERTVISTHTINLQEQLLNKDIPLLFKVFDTTFKAVLVKGMGNYLCLRKLEDAKIAPSDDAEALAKIDSWVGKTIDGSRSDLPFLPSAVVWNRVNAESDACNATRCPHYKDCYFFRARRKANDAQIIIVNHHLLFSDIVMRMEGGSFSESGILPGYGRLILDEAHNVEDVATDHFASRIDRLILLHQFKKLHAEVNEYANGGKLSLLKHKILKYYGAKENVDVIALVNRLTMELPAEQEQLSIHVNDVFSKIEAFCRHFPAAGDDGFAGGQKWRLRAGHFNHPYWVKELCPAVKHLMEALKSFIESIDGIKDDVKDLKNAILDSDAEGIFLDIGAVKTYLVKACELFKAFFFNELSRSAVRWIEVFSVSGVSNVRIIDAELDISSMLADSIFSKLQTVVLCSATLATNAKFSFIRERLGILEEKLSGRAVVENIYNSPFDYKKQAMLAVPTDMPNPMDHRFTEEASHNIMEVVKACRGNAFVLFTSHAMMRECYGHVKDALECRKHRVFLQGDASRDSLLSMFRETDRSILFGTDSFWEGVDVVGEALRCVVIVKLPFRVPTEPITEARSEFIEKNGGRPFIDYTVPSAIVKFKQGFGRLIRNSSDRGCIVCLDPRIVKKPYGKLFIKSLPECQHAMDAGSALPEMIEKFYKKTYRLTKKKSGA